MKKYSSYMDRVAVSDELHEKMLHLEEPVKKPVRWQRYAAAACAVLLVGVGAWNIGTWLYAERWRTQVASYKPFATAEISPAEASSGYVPGMKTIGGYEERIPWEGQELVRYHVLPWIDYGTQSNAAALDWALPEGVTERDLTAEEIVALLGGETAVDLHLDWGEYELTGWAAWYADGSFWGAYLMGYKGPMDHFEFAVTAGQLPPSCIVFEGSVAQDIWGVTVTADKHDGEGGCARRVSFMKDGYGYRFDLTATGETEAAEKLVSRVVAYVVNEGLDFAPFTGEEPPEPDPLPADPDALAEPSPSPTNAAASVPPASPQDGASVPPAGADPDE